MTTSNKAPTPPLSSPAAAPASLPFTFPDAVAAAPAPASTRERILHAAFMVLNDEGFGALTQTRVAERAGVRQSHLTYYFPTRIALLRETAVFGCNAMLEMMASAIDSGALTLANFRQFLVADVSDRRFARLMCALIVASDEDQSIKPWLASFEDVNRQRLQESFRRLGLDVTRSDIELFHAAYVGAVILDLGEANEQSLARSQRIVQTAFDLIAARSTAMAQPRPKPISKRVTGTNKS
jgi:AcrR family transcriptional regulator